MSKIVNLIAVFLWIYLAYRSVYSYINILVSKTYQALSNDDYQDIEFTLLLGGLTAIYSIVVLFVNYKYHKVK
jgi:hypothetical protein